VGEYLKGKQRDKIVLVTKCAHHDLSLKYAPPRLAPEDIRGDFETSLSELSVDYADVLFLHRDDIKRTVEEIMPVLHEFVKAGKVRILGASNWTGARIQEANRFALENGLTPFSISQLHYSLGLTTPAASADWTHLVMDNIEHSWYAGTKLPVMAWSASAKGFFSKVAAGEELAAACTARYAWLEENHRRAERVKTLAAQLGASIGAVVLAYLMCDEDVPTCALVSFSRKEQYEEAIEAAKLVLTKEQRRYLEGM
jgi:aryl-alcohol dehydrogenase-like predicted oxidoreductase